MHVSPLGVNSSAVAAERLSTRAVQQRGGTLPPAAAATPTRTDAALRGGLRRLDLQLNRQAAALQQTIAFVAQAQNQLARLKADLSAVAAEQRELAADTQRQLQQFAAHWSRRAEATAGSLNAKLRLVGAGQAQQQFSIHGLDEQSAPPTGTENLLFSVRGRQSTLVVLDADLSPGANARRLNQALAPLGVEVAASAQGALQFRAEESAWPALRDSLMIKGEGRLFPTGQFNRVRSSAEPELVHPAAWLIDEPQAARQTLRDVVTTGNRLQAVARQAGESLRELAPGADAPDASGALRLAQGFGAQATNASFTALANVLPASLGLSRERVTALLGLAP